METHHCFNCDSFIDMLDSSSNFNLVSSDSRRPLYVSSEVGICDACGIVQRPRFTEWKNRCEEIYKTYIPYPQGEQSEVKNFTNNVSGESRSRSALIEFEKHFPLLRGSKWLDFGCGSGELLSIVGERHDDVLLFGTDKSRYSEACIREHSQIAFVDIEELTERKYDVISLFHVLEHVEDPVNLLKTLKSCLKSRGNLLIRVPTYEKNPYDLLIYDHANFFSLNSLSVIVEKANLSIIEGSTEWVPKEIGMVVSAARTEINHQHRGYHGDYKKVVRACFNLLRDQVNIAERALSENGKINIFGTAIGAAWLASEIGVDNVNTFFDEDRSRCGSSFLGRPVHFPDVDSIYPTVAPLDPVTKARIGSRYPGVI